ncbi:MAG: radical SAM protein [Candidatus Kapabacteria bacterium]|nr:radical SAM protein [Candidatus Kapabacteria bacterium]
MNKVKHYLNPPALAFKQAGSFVLYSSLIGWNKSLQWLIRHGFSTLPVSAGAIGMGCIGFPNHPVWEITTACNERCLHCHANGGKPQKDELNTAEGFRLIEDIAKCEEFRMLVYTGGEPLVRKDLFDLLAYSQKIGFKNVIATNAIDIDDAMAKELKKLGVYGLAISLDHIDPEVHNHIRQRKDAFELALRGIEACRKNGIILQINITAMEYNINKIQEILQFADKADAAIVLNYQLVSVGRAANIEEKVISIEKNRSLMNNLLKWQKDITPIIEPVASPQYWPNMLIKKGKFQDYHIKIAKNFFHGCTAGIGLAYIKPNGDIWPCPFVEVSAGNVREKPFNEIWRNSEYLQKLRNRDNLGGSCGNCRFNVLCGGCRGKAWAASGDSFAEDPTCFIPDDIKLKK